MEMLKLNETPVRTSRNFNINNIKLENVEIPNNIGEFNNVEILGETSKIKVDSNIDDFKLTYGVGVKSKEVNKKIKLIVDSKINKELQINFKFDNDNLNLVDKIQVVANEDSKATIILKYESLDDVKSFHNGVLNVIAKENSYLNIIIINLISITSNHFYNIESIIEKNAHVKYTIVDLGGQNSITNYYSNLVGENSDNKINAIYLGKKNQIFDLNYIAELRGEKSNVNIEVQGALKDCSKKHFKGTIDFKKGCKKAKGNENESCMLLSDKSRSLALPMLLCTEEDVEGNHSTSSGKVGDRELFYIMSRGIERKDAIKLMVRAKFNSILEDIKNDMIKNQLFYEIDKRLD